MLRTSLQEGGQQPRTESPKTTSGAPNGFVRPVAVASIFRPALGSGIGVSSTGEKNPAPSEKRGSSGAKESKVFGSSLSSGEFSRRRQSFDAKDVVPQGPSASLKQASGNQPSPGGIKLESEALQQNGNETSAEENSEIIKEKGSGSATLNAAITKLKGNDLLTETSTVVKASSITKTEVLNQKDKVSKDVLSHDKPSRRNKVSSFSPGSNSITVASVNENSSLVIQNGISEESDISTVTVRSRSRNSGAAGCAENSTTPQAEKRRDKFSLGTCTERKSVSQASYTSDSAKIQSSSKDNIIFPANTEVTRDRSNRIIGEASTKNLSVSAAEHVQQSAAVHSDRQHGNKTLKDLTVKQSVNVSDVQAAEKDLSSPSTCKGDYNFSLKESSTAQAKSDSQPDASNFDLHRKNDNKKDSIETSDAESPGKFRTCRRTSDVIAAKIQSFFSKSNQPTTLSPSQNKLNSACKDKSITEKESKCEVSSSEKNVLVQESTAQKVSETKNLDQKKDHSHKDSLCAVVHSVSLSGDGTQLGKIDSVHVNKQQSRKCLEKVETVENTLKPTSRSQSQIGSSTSANSNFTSLLNSEKVVARNHTKDQKFISGQKSYDFTASFTVKSIKSNSAYTEKKYTEPREIPQCIENAATPGKEVSSTKKELTSTSVLVKEEKTSTASVVRKPVALVNFFITEVSVENSPQPQRINVGKVSPLPLAKTESSQIVEQKSHVTQKSDANKCVNDDSEVKHVTLKSKIINHEVVASKCADKNKVGKSGLLNEGNKVSSVDQQQEDGPVKKSFPEENFKGVTLKSSEKDKTYNGLTSNEKNKVPSGNLPQKSSETQNSDAVKNISGHTKALCYTSSELTNSEFQDLKLTEKDKKVVPVNVLKNIDQTQKTSGKINTSHDTKACNFGGSERVNSRFSVSKPPEKDKIDKVVPLKEGNKLTCVNTQQKNNQLQKSGTEVRTVIKVESSTGNELVHSVVSPLNTAEKNKTDKPLLLKEANKVEPERIAPKGNEVQKSGAEGNLTGVGGSLGFLNCNRVNAKVQVSKPLEKDDLSLKTLQVQKSDAKTKLGSGVKSQDSTCSEILNPGIQVLKPSEKDKTDKALKEVSSEKLKQKDSHTEKHGSENSTVSDTKVLNCTSAELVHSVSEALKPSETDKRYQSIQHKENQAVPRSLNRKSDVFQKWHEKQNVSGVLKSQNISSNNVTVISSDASMSKQSSGATGTTLLQQNEIHLPSEKIKSRFSAGKQLLADEHLPCNCGSENVVSHTESVNSSQINSNKDQQIEVKTKSVNSAEEKARDLEQQATEDKIFPKLKKFSRKDQKPDGSAKHLEVNKMTSAVKKTASLQHSHAEGIASPIKLLQDGRSVETCQPVLSSHNHSTETNSKEKSGESTAKDAKCSSLGSQNLPCTKAESAQKDLCVDNTNKVSVCQNTLKTSFSGQVTSSFSGRLTDTVKSPVSVDISKTKRSAFLVSSKYELKECAKGAQENHCYKNKMPEISEDSQDGSLPVGVRGKDTQHSVSLTTVSVPSIKSSNSSLNSPEIPSPTSFPFSKLETPRPPERKRAGYLRDALMSPPLIPLHSVSRTGSLKHPNDNRFSLERSLPILRSSSQTVLGPSYTAQRISYTQMLSKLGTCGLNPSMSTTNNRKFRTSQVSELWADLGEEQSNIAHTSEMLESETSERMRLEKEVQELQSRYSQVQQKSDKMEMEMMEARAYRAAEVNGDISEEEENEATISLYKQKYERAVRDMEVMKRRLQQQYEEEMEQSLMLKKAADKRLTEAMEDVEEERQVVNQWKRKAQKLGAELQDLRLMLEEQMARNGELEKKQRRFDAELSAAQEEIRKEHQLREKLNREKDQAQLEKYSLEQELQATRLDMDMQHEKIALLNRELDELSLSSKGEEEVTQLKRAKQELERKTRDQEEELEELAGQVQLLEQSKLRLEMSLEKLRQEHRRELSVRDEEIEEIRACSSKKIKNLEAQLENEQEERHQLVKQKHELERRIIELSDQPPPQDPEIERRLRRDLKRTKALLRDAHAMLEHTRDGQTNKTLIRQLKNQLEDAEFTKSVAIKARQSAELELQELQLQLEDVTNTKNDVESRCLQLSREKSTLQTQLEEMEEEMAEVMKKYKAAVAQMSIDQKSLAEQTQQISELETEKMALKEQLADVSSKLDHVSVHTEDSAKVHRLDAKVRDLESKLELEQTTRSRLEHQIARLKEQCDRSREECDSLRNKELQAQEGMRRLQRQLRELREDYAALQQKESEAYRKQHELEIALENTEADLQITKNDLRLACQRIQDLQSVLEDDLDSGTDVPDDSGSETDSSLDVSILGQQCLAPIQRSDSLSSNTSIGSEGRQFRPLSHSQDMAYFSRMMQRRTPMNFLV